MTFKSDSVQSLSFDWDSSKELGNIKKHRVGFVEASSIFRDPKIMTIFDDEHSYNEDRWISMGVSERGRLLVVVHTFRQIDERDCQIRVISARKATLKEGASFKGR